MFGNKLFLWTVAIGVRVGVLLVDAHDSREDKRAHKHGDADKEHCDVVPNAQVVEEGDGCCGGKDDSKGHGKDRKNLCHGVAFPQEKVAEGEAHDKRPAAHDHVDRHSDVERKCLVVYHGNAEEQEIVDDVALHRKDPFAYSDHPPVLVLKFLYLDLSKEPYK